ncbi:MAG: pyrroloquinoline quinone-dependent dehydrogenase [Saprospiraceae bacterium]|nr:pyrroloquinoline quinone-dependent dehydrogenase [Saprospiraceae bacterium]
MKNRTIYFVLSLLPSLVACTADQPDYSEWREYLGGPDRNHYSSLTEITPENVQQLKVAWTYAAPDSGQMQMTPIIVDGILFGVTATVQAFALDAATGKEIWRFGDPLRVWHSTSRGVAYWENGEDKRILYTIGPKLYALNAKTGKPIETFGDKGSVDLHEGLPQSARDKFIISNTPGTIFENLIIMPLRLAEDAEAAPGDVRAFDVVSGKLVWTFHTIPYPYEMGYETWENKEAYLNTTVGGANNWAGMAVDRKAGVLFVPTGSAAPDFFGGQRTGKNLYANCLLALNARTGEKIWHYQFTHHDIWDRDPPAPPNLIKVRRFGKVIDAVAQVTKQGYVFVFDRKTGQSLYPIEEVEALPSPLAEEKAWPTQPIPVAPQPFARQAYELTENDLSPYAENRAELLEAFRKLDRRRFAPPSLEGVLLLPGYDGGAEWGGAAADPEDGILYVNSNEMAWILKLEANSQVGASLPLGEATYLKLCASCHQVNLSGNALSGYPSLVDISRKRSRNYISGLVTSGKGMMPGFPQITGDAKQALLDFLLGLEKKEGGEGIATAALPDLPYKHTGYHKFLDSNGLPGIAPPWGTLSAIDLNTGAYRWKVTLGDTDSLKQKGHPPTGCESYGGPVVTASGLLFIAGTKDGKFRAFNKNNGKLLWETTLPAAAFATPATYEVNGKQYIALACGGEKLGTPKGNKVVAFALE